MTPHSRETLLALADRAEKATGPDRELDELISAAVEGAVREVQQDGRTAYHSLDGGTWVHIRVPQPGYTASLDAAMSLVPEGWRWVLRQATADECNGAFFCRLESGDFKSITWGKGGEYITDVISGVDVFCWSATPALALVAAALRAHATLEPTGEKA